LDCAYATQHMAGATGNIRQAWKPTSQSNGCFQACCQFLLSYWNYGDAVMSIIDDIGNALSNVVGAVGNAVTTTVNAVVDTVKSTADTIAGLFHRLFR
jgi:hypothetical protein